MALTENQLNQLRQKNTSKILHSRFRRTNLLAEKQKRLIKKFRKEQNKKIA